MIYQICDIMMNIMRQGTFLSIAFEPQLIKSPNLTNEFFEQFFEDWG